LDLLLSVVGELAGWRERSLSGYFDTLRVNVAIASRIVSPSTVRVSASRWMPFTAVGVKDSLRVASLGV
jgi:hypothetical protein